MDRGRGGRGRGQQPSRSPSPPSPPRGRGMPSLAELEARGPRPWQPEPLPSAYRDLEGLRLRPGFPTARRGSYRGRRYVGPYSEFHDGAWEDRNPFPGPGEEPAPLFDTPQNREFHHPDGNRLYAFRGNESGYVSDSAVCPLEEGPPQGQAAAYVPAYDERGYLLPRMVEPRPQGNNPSEAEEIRRDNRRHLRRPASPCYDEARAPSPEVMRRPRFAEGPPQDPERPRTPLRRPQAPAQPVEPQFLTPRPIHEQQGAIPRVPVRLAPLQGAPVPPPAPVVPQRAPAVLTTEDFRRMDVGWPPIWRGCFRCRSYYHSMRECDRPANEPICSQCSARGYTRWTCPRPSCRWKASHPRR